MSLPLGNAAYISPKPPAARDGSVIYVSHAIPSPEGHGGNHRAYQVLGDLEAAFGRRVSLFSVPRWRQSRPSEFQFNTSHPRRWRRLASRARRWWLRNADNPYRLLSRAAYGSFVPFAPAGLLNPDFVREYEAAVAALPRPAVCILEQSSFGEVLEVNGRHGVPTVSACQNIEAFDVLDIDFASRRSVSAATLDFANELRALARCVARLVISRVEAGVLGGLGLECHYYPYVPSGLVRQRLRQIHERRAAGGVDPNLFLMLGSAEHQPTGKSLAWFVQQARAHSLPPDVRVVVIGAGTERFAAHATGLTGFQFRGWLQQADLDELMRRTAAVLVPQRVGFGALTRLPELACAGIPVLAARHPTYAIDPTPGLRVVGADWDDWRAAVADVSRYPGRSSDEEYAAWEARQPCPVGGLVDQLLRQG